MESSMEGKKDSSTLEFKYDLDDAWYSVRVLLEKDSHANYLLRVKYCGFSDENDNVFNANSFRTLDELQDFANRFRPESHQLQDSDCYHVHQAMVVCACYSLRDDDLRFYDAVVDEVNRQQHSFTKGEEECSCTFILLWRTGPNAGNLSAERIENICAVLVNEKIDPILASFIRIAKEKTDILKVCNSSTVSESEVAKRKVADCHEKKKTPKLTIRDRPSLSDLSNTVVKPCEEMPRSLKRDRLSSYSLKLASFVVAANDGQSHTLNNQGSPSFSQLLKQEPNCAGGSIDSPWWYKCMFEHSSKTNDQDKDIGGAYNYYLIFVENLEKGLTPTTIMEFIYKKVFISSEAFVFPSLLSEFCVRGNVLVEGEKNFKKLCDFLENPDHIIVSSRGRPLVITEKMLVHDSCRAWLKTSFLVSQRTLKSSNVGSTNELKVLSKKSKEYNKLKYLQDLYKGCQVHLQEPLKRYVSIEEKILHLSDA